MQSAPLCFAHRSRPGCSPTTSAARPRARPSLPACRKAGWASRKTSPGRCCFWRRKHRISTPVTFSMAKARIAVIGAGLMGHGIAQVFALAGHEVTITDTVTANLDNAKARILTNLKDLGDDQKAVERVTPVSDLSQTVRDADYVVEA